MIIKVLSYLTALLFIGFGIVKGKQRAMWLKKKEKRKWLLNIRLAGFYHRNLEIKSGMPN